MPCVINHKDLSADQQVAILPIIKKFSKNVGPLLAECAMQDHATSYLHTIVIDELITIATNKNEDPLKRTLVFTNWPLNHINDTLRAKSIKTILEILHDSSEEQGIKINIIKHLSYWLDNYRYKDKESIDETVKKMIDELAKLITPRTPEKILKAVINGLFVNRHVMTSFDATSKYLFSLWCRMYNDTKIPFHIRDMMKIA